MSDTPPPLACRVAELEARVAALEAWQATVPHFDLRLTDTTGTAATPRGGTFLGGGHPPAWPL